jgi:hypothetical protein
MIISLIAVVVLICSSLFVSTFLVTDGGGSVRVKSSVELRDAVNNAEVGVHTDIALTKDISIGTLVIPAGADITLKSASSNNSFFRLVSMADVSVITVESGGRLTIDGIIVTHKGAYGVGVVVEVGGALIMIDGEITGNTEGANSSCGVAVKGGVFELIGGVISNNGGGGVSVSRGTFTMSGGKIIDNMITIGPLDYGGYGGGVTNGGTFTMTGGVIANNTATGKGGGVDNYGVFEMHGGEILDNTAGSGGGVNVGSSGTFNMYNGKINNNKANDGGGVFIYGGTFNMSGGIVSSNTANTGGGVFNCNYGTINRSGGEISGNIADTGNDVYELME